MNSKGISISKRRKFCALVVIAALATKPAKAISSLPDLFPIEPPEIRGKPQAPQLTYIHITLEVRKRLQWVCLVLTVVIGKSFCGTITIAYLKAQRLSEQVFRRRFEVGRTLDACDCRLRQCAHWMQRSLHQLSPDCERARRK